MRDAAGSPLTEFSRPAGVESDQKFTTCAEDSKYCKKASWLLRLPAANLGRQERGARRARFAARSRRQGVWRRSVQRLCARALGAASDRKKSQNGTKWPRISSRTHRRAWRDGRRKQATKTKKALLSCFGGLLLLLGTQRVHDRFMSGPVTGPRHDTFLHEQTFLREQTTDVSPKWGTLVPLL